MKTAIIYSTSHGTTEKVCAIIRSKLNPNETIIYNLKEKPEIDFSMFDVVIMGGSIHAGNIQPRVKNFMQDNMNELVQKKVGLFLCCMNEPDFQKQFEKAFPQQLREHASGKMIAGGEFLFDKMNFIERALVKKISGFKESVSKINLEEIDQFVFQLTKS